MKKILLTLSIFTTVYANAEVTCDTAMRNLKISVASSGLFTVSMYQLNPQAMTTKLLKDELQKLKANVDLILDFRISFDAKLPNGRIDPRMERVKLSLDLSEVPFFRDLAFTEKIYKGAMREYILHEIKKAVNVLADVENIKVLEITDLRLFGFEMPKISRIYVANEYYQQDIIGTRPSLQSLNKIGKENNSFMLINDISEAITNDMKLAREVELDSIIARANDRNRIKSRLMTSRTLQMTLVGLMLWGSYTSFNAITNEDLNKIPDCF